MRTEQVKYFLETVKYGSFTKAAENLHIQQPSLREAIINLENELGEALFYRSKKGVQLTEYGRYCLPLFQLIHENYEKMREKDRVLYPPSVLHVDVQSDFDFFVSAFYSAVRMQLREHELLINVSNDLNAIANRLVQEKTQLAFVCAPADEIKNSVYQTMKEQSLESSELLRFETVLLMRKNHPLAAKKIITYKDLREFVLISNSYSGSTANLLKQRGILSMEQIIKIGNWNLVESYLRSTDVLTISAKGTTHGDELEARPLKDAPTMVMQALYKKGCMDESILHCINVMKLTAGNYIR